jgi:hypothetical protein
MTSTVRSLLFTTSLYFAALGAVAAGLYGSLSVLAPAVQAHFLHGGERPQSRIDVMVANAREIRQSLATPVAAVEPLPPITARPVRATAMKPDKVSSRRPNAEARDVFAMSERNGGSMTMSVDRYRPQ